MAETLIEPTKREELSDYSKKAWEGHLLLRVYYPIFEDYYATMIKIWDQEHPTVLNPDSFAVSSDFKAIVGIAREKGK